MDGPIASGSANSLRWIADRNPFYLLSAFCGLLGCWLLGDVARADIANVAMRIASLLAYQLIVVFLALWLARRKSAERDVAILAVLTFVLATDFSFFYTQSAMLRPLPAGVFALFGAAQSLALVGVLLKRLEVRLSKDAEWLLGADLVTAHLLPLVIRLSIGDEVPLPLMFLYAFVAVGALLAAHAWPTHWREDESNANPLARGLALAAPIVALTSVVAHAFAAMWVYDIFFVSVFLSPLCLGGAAMCLRMEARRTEADSPFTPGAAAAALSGLAVYFTLGNRLRIEAWDVDGGSWLGLSPLRLSLLGAAAIFYGLWRIRGGNGALALACCSAALMILGHTPEAMRRHIAGIARVVDTLLSNALPASRAGWGVCLFASAFLLLGLGAWLSWWKTRGNSG